MNLYQFVQKLMYDALSKGVEIVQYARRGKIASQYFLGREYPWNQKMNAYGRWVTGRGGAKYFINFETLVRRAIEKNNPTPEEFAGMFGKRPDASKRQEIREKMIVAELKTIVELALKGRTILPDNKKEDFKFEDERLPKLVDANYAGTTVTLYKTIPHTKIKVLCQRRAYDKNGVVLQDFDYWHGKEETHVFPHIHIWFEPSYDKRSIQLKYR